MRILVTGATGLVGSAVARELASRGHAVRALLRPASRLDNLHGMSFERAAGDVLDRASVERALDGCEAVVHSAGAAHFRPGEERSLHALNVESVEIVLGAALRAGVHRAVLTSSVAVQGGTPAPAVLDERTPGNAERLGIDYFASKLRGERAALELAVRGLPVCVVRPSVVLGPGDIYHSSATTVLAVARGRLRVYVRGGASFCDVRDVARGHAEALLRGTPGEAYVLGGHNLETGEFLRRVAEAAGVPTPRPIPYAAAIAAAAMAEGWARLRGGKASMSRQLVRASGLYSFVSSAKAMAQLGYTIRPFEETLRDTLRWFLAQGRLRPSTPRLQALAG